ncbi:hypothetical protein AVDCRST_MAG81-4514 [uncultured Synechococcales cyanobacterium]|uniref:DUF6888 domain-containing protein n=1 Tax=uncultured Synechococcales cyanobacterium TaxID=1936017 RepID=A0A6J4VWA6_9CYAN|nr:hypothetical protein AVDCRST_MAG81-4514 [uncultured Synechococcales cyanobacterium]
MASIVSQLQGFYRLCHRLANAIDPSWQYKAIDFVRMNERNESLLLLGHDLESEIKSSGGYQP